MIKKTNEVGQIYTKIATLKSDSESLYEAKEGQLQSEKRRLDTQK